MQVGNLVKIIAPESVVGWPAGKIGLISTVLGKYHPVDYIISVIYNRNIKNVYVCHNEIEIIKE